jgi:hypothetical protein
MVRPIGPLAAALVLTLVGAALSSGLAVAEQAAASGSSAARGLVVVLVPDVQDEITRNAMARISGELAAAPFTVVTQRVDPATDLLTQLENTGKELDPAAAFAIVREGPTAGAPVGPGSVAVWVSNRITHTTTVQRVAIQSGDVDGAAAHLAVEAVELVRASMPGLWPGSPPVAEGEPSPPVRTAVESRLQVAVGIDVSRDFSSGPTFWAPMVGVSYGHADGLRVRLSLEGLGPGADVTAAGGSGGARLERAAGKLGIVRAFRTNRTFQPVVSLAVGAQMLVAQGTGAPSNRVRRETAWSGLGAAGFGGQIALGAHLAIAAEAQLVLLFPDAVVQADTTNVAHLERLTFNADVGLVARF